MYKARDRKTKKIVALKKVRFDTSEPESVKFMAREIMMLRKLDHPNIVKLEGLATSRMQYSLYLVFDYMQTDLSRLISRPDERLTEPQVRSFLDSYIFQTSKNFRNYSCFSIHNAMLSCPGEILHETIAFGASTLSRKGDFAS